MDFATGFLRESQLDYVQAADEMDVNAIKEKQLTNHRAAGSDDLVRLVPARVMSLEQALEFITDDECVEVTPHNVRLRKVVLGASATGKDLCGCVCSNE